MEGEDVPDESPGHGDETEDEPLALVLLEGDICGKVWSAIMLLAKQDRHREVVR